ncbi:MAG: GNAT family N-acetyltransferase [Bacteroidales bacterium]|nr:GNAT family N-acetyltransferase [Bacteroidales bacterium]
MRFRDYKDDDFPELLALWKALDMGGHERGDTAETVRQTLKLGGKLIILDNEHTGEIIGSSWITYDGRRLFLHHFGIKKEYQRQGLGMQLAMETMKFVKEKGCQVKLEVDSDNIPAKRLYEKIGFGAFPGYDIYMIRKTDEIITETAAAHHRTHR